MIEKITSAQYLGYFSDSLRYTYVDRFREKKEELRVKKILEERAKKVQGDIETGKLIDFFA
ncbi:hypothetical protein M0R72_09840 [Candidatus Pacearchaeota archaeon]|nr:hypothetical protein [Candidatus Pacearchaeota archaeon]